jgi:HEAT repeat protein
MFEGVIVPIGVLLAVFILFLLQVLTLSILFPLILCFIGITLIILSYRLIPKYTHCAIKNLSVAKNIREQLHAIEVLGQKGHCQEQATKTLCHILEQTETHDAIREKIIRTLQHIQSNETLHDFSRILEKEEESIEIKVKILEAMLKFDSLREFGKSKMFAQHKLLAILNTLFESTNHEYLKKLIIMNIFSHLPADQVVPFFLKIMKSDDEKLQAVCLRSCQMFDDPDIVSYIEPYLNHENSRVRSHALISLWKFHDKDLLQKYLLELLQTENHEYIIAGVYAIGEIQDANNQELLLPFLNHENNEVRIHALIAQAKLGDESCVSSLIEILFGENEELAHKVFEMLKRRVPKNVYDELIHQIKHRVAKKVWEIIGHHPKPSILQSLSPERILYLRRLYTFAGQHDDILILEQAVVANA